MSGKCAAFDACWVTVGDLEDPLCVIRKQHCGWSPHQEKEPAYSISSTHSPSVHRTRNRMDQSAMMRLLREAVTQKSMSMYALSCTQ